MRATLLVALASLGYVAQAAMWSWTDDFINNANVELSLTTTGDIVYGTHYASSEETTAKIHTENYGLDLYAYADATAVFKVDKWIDLEITATFYPVWATLIDHYFIINRMSAGSNFGITMKT